MVEYDALSDLSSHSLGGTGTGGEGEDTGNAAPLAHLGDAERYYDLWKDKPVEDTLINENNNDNNDNQPPPEAFPFDEEAFVSPLTNSPNVPDLPPGNIYKQTILTR